VHVTVRAQLAAAVLSLAVAMLIASAILLSATDLGPLALASVLLLDALAVVGRESLSGVRKA